MQFNEQQFSDDTESHISRIVSSSFSATVRVARCMDECMECEDEVTTVDDVSNFLRWDA